MSYEYEKIENIYNKEYESKIEQIEQIREELAGKSFAIDSLIGEDVFENVSIEGNTMTRSEVTYLLENDVTIRGRNIKEHLQVKNYSNMLDTLKLFVCDQMLKITPEIIKKIHKIITINELTEEECGQFRQELVHIRYTNYIPPMEWEIESLISELCRELYAPLCEETMFERICEFKRNFERIHPFVDGNGRTGRLLANLLFLQNGYGYISFPPEERDVYFDSLENNTFHCYAAEKMLNSMNKIREAYNEKERE